MTDVNAINGYTLTGSSSASTSSSSQTLSADMNTFLTLLTTQLKYQDPLDPMDTADFTNQLVQYSSVEQAIQTNSKLDSLLSLYTSNLGAQAVSYIGKVAQVLGDVMPLQDGQAKAAYTLDKDVKSVTIYVKDLNGNTVYSTNGETSSGTHEFDWDGKTSGGQQLEDGAYQIIVSAQTATGETAANVTTTIFGKVTGVASDSEGVYIGLGDAVTANLNDILTVRADDYFNKGSSDKTDGVGEDNASGEDEDSTEDTSIVDDIIDAAVSAATIAGSALAII